MCGIAGAIGKYNKNRVFYLISSLRHRGPDSCPIVVSKKNVFIAATRLSIVDINSGQQPMFDTNTDNIAAFNGEIYNHRKLREELEAKGIKFNTQCDTEVILKGFSFFGPSFVNKLEGIFAIAFYSSSKETLYLFRDYFGVKPLYYSFTEKGLEFASEAKSFFIGTNKCNIEPDFLIYNKIMGCSPPELSIFKGVKSVMPGTYLAYKNYSKSIHSYTPGIKCRLPNSIKDAAKTSKEEIIKSVASQIPTEVDWGVLLSGGIDSSILAYACNKLTNNKITTFTVGPKEGNTDDLICARQVANNIGSRHREIRVDFKKTLKLYDDYIFSIEDINPKFFFYYFLSKYVSKFIKVALCGEGADELYAGYPVYRQIDNFLIDINKRFKLLRKFLSLEMRKNIKTSIKEMEEKKFRGVYNFMITKQLPYFQLNVVDKCSMRFGVEFRVPYLDLNHAFCVMKYPETYLKESGVEKEILRLAFCNSGLPTLQRSKAFAGTRTLPYFYEKISVIANKKYDALIIKHPDMFFLNSIELYSLNLFYKKMINSKRILSKGIKFIKL